MLFTVTIACLALTLGVTSLPTLGQKDGDGDEGMMVVTLLYESYCPYCIQYLGDQLIPAWKSFQGKISLDIVPFGNARQWYEDGHYKFECQHGPKECVGNKLHACAIQQACGEAGTRGCAVEAVTRALDYVHCLEEAPDQEKANGKCSSKVQLKADSIAKCANGEAGGRLLSLYGNQTAQFGSQMTGVPAIALDGMLNDKAVDDLVGEICNARPELCPALITV